MNEQQLLQMISAMLDEKLKAVQDHMEERMDQLGEEIKKLEQKTEDIEFIIETRLALEMHAIVEENSFINSKLVYMIEMVGKYKEISQTLNDLYYEFQRIKRQQYTA